MVDGSSVMDAGSSNTVVGIVVNQPGTVTPVESSVVGDALHQTLQEDGQTQISNLTLGVVNAPTVSDNQRDNAISVGLTGTQPSEVRFVFTKIDENHIGPNSNVTDLGKSLGHDFGRLKLFSIPCISSKY
jgi:hypothetical protein